MVLLALRPAYARHHLAGAPLENEQLVSGVLKLLQHSAMATAEDHGCRCFGMFNR